MAVVIKEEFDAITDMATGDFNVPHLTSEDARGKLFRGAGRGFHRSDVNQFKLQVADVLDMYEQHQEDMADEIELLKAQLEYVKGQLEEKQEALDSVTKHLHNIEEKLSETGASNITMQAEIIKRQEDAARQRVEDMISETNKACEALMDAAADRADEIVAQAGPALVPEPQPTGAFGTDVQARVDFLAARKKAREEFVKRQEEWDQKYEASFRAYLETIVQQAQDGLAMLDVQTGPIPALPSAPSPKVKVGST